MANADFFGASSGIGPQNGGFNPTPADAIHSSLRARSSQGLMEYAMVNDPMFRATTGLAATAIAGDATQAQALLKNTAAGQLIKDAVGVLMSSGLMPGGSPMNLAYNVQSMMATQGISVGGNLGRNNTVFGAGAITDQMAKTAFDAITSKFYDKVSGLPQHSAFGLNKSQMGDAIAYMNSRGAFAGTNFGSLRQFSDKAAVDAELKRARASGADTEYIKELEQFSRDNRGGMAFELDKGQMNRVNKTLSSYASMLKDAREIFGDLPINELTQNAERLVGSSLQQSGAIEQMKERMASVKATALAYGANAEAVAKTIMSNSDQLQRTMYGKGMQSDPAMGRLAFNAEVATGGFASASANVAGSAMVSALGMAHTSSVTANAYKAQGKYIANYDEQQLAAGIQGGISNMMFDPETSAGRVAHYALATGRIVDSEGQARLRSLLSQATAAKSVEESRNLNNVIYSELRAQGVDAGYIENSVSVGEQLLAMGPDGAKAYTDELSKQHSNRMLYEGLKQLNNETHGAGYTSGLLVTDSNRQNFGALFKALGKDAQDKLLGSVNNDGSIDTATMDAAYAAIPGLAETLSPEAFQSIIAGFRDAPNRTQGSLRGQLGALMDSARTNSRFAMVENSTDALMANKRATQAYLASQSMGEGLSQEDFMSSVIRGFFGSAAITDEMIMRAAAGDSNVAGNILSLKLNADKTGIDLEGSNANDFHALLGSGASDFYRRAGMSGGVEDMADYFSNLTPEKIAQIKAAGLTVGVDGQGNFNILGARHSQEVTKRLERAAMLQNANNLLGEDVIDVGAADLESEDGRATYYKAIRDELSAPDRMAELAAAAAHKDYAGSQYEALVGAYNNDPLLAGILKEQETKAADNGDTQKAKDLKNLRAHLNGDTNNNRFVGILELASDTIAQLRVSQISGSYD